MSENYTYIDDGLLVKYLLGEASDEEQGQVLLWMKANEANQKYFEQFQSLWLQSQSLAATSPVDENAAWRRFQSRIHRESKAAPVVTLKKMNWIRIAALFILIAGAALLGYQLSRDEEAVQEIALQTKTNVLVDTLPDGSEITLNKNSSLRYPDQFKGDKRSVSLNGEAFFKVKPDKKKPFEITVNDVTVRVVGTSFNIRSQQGFTEVIVETGVVQVTRNNKTVELRPTEKIVVRAQDSMMVKEKEAQQLFRYYVSKEFVCDNTPLWKLVEVLNEAYGVHIVIERTELRNLPLNVTFSNESLDVILEIIRETFNTYQIEIIKTKDKIRLR